MHAPRLNRADADDVLRASPSKHRPIARVDWDAITSSAMARTPLTGCTHPAGERRGRDSVVSDCPVSVYVVSASAPATTSRISWVISACRARFIASVSESMSSPAAFDAFRIAVIRAPCSEAADSRRAR